MLNKKVLILLVAMAIMPKIFYGNSQQPIGKVSAITGNNSNRVVKIAEAIERKATARRLARAGKFDEALNIISPITQKNGFEFDDEQCGYFAKADILILKGDYEQAYELVRNLDAEKKLNPDYIDFVKTLSDFATTKNPEIVFNYVYLYNSRNKNIIPPKVHDLNYLSRMVRLYEMAAEIDQALQLVDQYFSKKSLKFHQSEKTREGFRLLKAALLRDKQESKNSYAQELLNTTDYFGFV